MSWPQLNTLTELLAGIDERGGATAICKFEPGSRRELTSAQFKQQAVRLAAGLQQQGLGRGGRVVLFAGTSVEWILAAVAVLHAGGVVVPVDAQLPEADLRHVLADSGAGWVITGARGLKRLQTLDLLGNRRVLLLGDSAAGVESLRQVMADDAAAFDSSVQQAVAPDDDAVIFYTSGTTGQPKGVPLTHRNITFELNTVFESDILRHDDRFLLPLPLHHVYPFVIGMLLPLAGRLPLVLPQGLTGPQIIRAVREGEVTAIVGVPRLYDALVTAIGDRVASRGKRAQRLLDGVVKLNIALKRRFGWNLGKKLLAPLHRQFGASLRMLASGGSPLDPDVAWKLEGLGWSVTIGYGLTETSPLITMVKPGQLLLDSVGRPIEGVEVRIDKVRVPADAHDEDELPQGEHQHGEVLCRGPNVFRGYLNLPDKTDEALEDGWFRTGDLGWFDDDGCLHLAGRANTMLVTEGGENVQPEAVEQAYLEHPLVREAGVLKREGQLVLLVVPEVGQFSEPGGDSSGEVLRQRLREAVGERSRELASYQRVADVQVTLDPLPRTRLGKIRRHELAQRYEQTLQGEAAPLDVGPVPIEKMSHEDQSLLEHDAALEIWQWLAERFPNRHLSPDTSVQLDLGVDSLEWLNLSLEIRDRAGVELSEEAIGRIETVRGLLREVTEASPAESQQQIERWLEDPDRWLSDRQKSMLRPHGPITTLAAWATYWVCRLLTKLAFGVEARGLEHLPKGGPFMLTPNHESYLDAFVLGSVLSFKQMNAMNWAGWTGVAFGNLIARTFSRLSHVVPIDARNSVRSSLALGAAVLKRGRPLGWFPEGGRSPDGTLQKFRSGVGIVLEHYPVAVVPAFIEGTYEAWPPKQKWPKCRKVTVTFGEPVDVKTLEAEGEGNKPEDRVADGLRKRVARLATES